MNKKVIAVGAIVVLALLVSGLMTGEIGAKLFRGKEAKGILPPPVMHLPPQPLYPQDAVDHFIEFEEHHSESPFKPMQLFISNTMLSAWITSLLLILLFVFGAAKPKLVPKGLQNFCEMILETLLGFTESVAGQKWGRKLFPMIVTIFLFVLTNAWLALLPIYPALGLLDHGEIKIHLLRSAATDMNMPLALALCSFVFIEFWGFRALGLSYMNKFVRVKDLMRGRILGGIDAFVGVLEGFTEFVRILSFTFRLFGNMTAGEVLVLISTFLVSFVATVAVYGLEMLVGIVQALIFAGLTLVFASIALTPHSHDEQHSTDKESAMSETH